MLGGELHLFLSAISLIIGVLSALGFLWLWLKEQRKYSFLLFWAIGLFLMYWLKLPAITAFLGIEFTIDATFRVLFITVLSSNLLSMAFVYHGLAFVSAPTRHRIIAWILWGWSLAGVIAMFSVGTSMPEVELVVQAVSLLYNTFFIPVLVLSLYALYVWWCRGLLSSMPMRLGASAITLGVLAKFAGVWVVTTRVQMYPDVFWFFSILSSWTLPIFQALSIIFLVVGFVLIYRECMLRVEDV